MWWSYSMDILQPQTLGYIGATLIIFLMLIFPWFSPRTKVIIARWGLAAAMFAAVIPGWYALQFYKSEAPGWRPGPTRSELMELESRQAAAEVQAMPRTENFDEKKAYATALERQGEWREWVSWALIGGMIVGIFFSFARLRGVQKMHQGSTPAPAEWQQFAVSYLGKAERIWTARPLEVWIHPKLEVPCIATYNKTWTIFLPEASREWPDDLREIVIRHEVEHVRQNDLFPVIFAEMLRIVTWMAPWAWFIPGLVRKNVELWADQRVIQGGVKASDYADALLKVGSRRAATPLLGLSMGSGGRLEHRIRSAVARTKWGRELHSQGIGVLSLVPMMVAMLVMGRSYGAFASPDPGLHAFMTQKSAPVATLTPRQGLTLSSGSQITLHEVWKMEQGQFMVYRPAAGWKAEKTWLLNSDQLSGGKRVMILKWTAGKGETEPRWLPGEAAPYGMFIDRDRRVPILLTAEQVQKGSVEMILSDRPWKKVGTWTAGSALPFHVGRYTQLRLEPWNAEKVMEQLRERDRRETGTDEFTSLHNPGIIGKATIAARSALLTEALGPAQEAEDRQVIIYGKSGKNQSLGDVNFRVVGTSDVQAFISDSSVDEIARIEFFERQGTRIRVSELPK